MLLLVTIIKCETLEVNFPVAYLFPLVFLGLKPAQCDSILTQSRPSKSRPKFVFEFCPGRRGEKMNSWLEFRMTSKKRTTTTITLAPKKNNLKGKRGEF